MSNDTSAPTVPEFLTVIELAAYLNVSANTLNHWRKEHIDSGPPWVKNGKMLRYPRKELDAWLEQKMHRPSVA